MKRVTVKRSAKIQMIGFSNWKLAMTKNTSESYDMTLLIKIPSEPFLEGDNIPYNRITQMK